MLARVPGALENATECTSKSDSETGVGSDSDDWFGAIARPLLGKDAGFALHLLTGVPEGSCYKYVTKKSENRRQPPAYLLRQILRSEQGNVWLNALMDGSSAGWWRDLAKARKVAALLSEEE